MVHRHSSKQSMETQQPAFSRQRRAGHLLRLYLGLPHPPPGPIRSWRPPTASKPVPVRNAWSRKILRCAPTICLFMELSCLGHLTSICCLQLSSLLRTPLALVFQIQRHSKLGEKSFHLGGSTPSSATFINYRIQRIRLITVFHGRSTDG